MSYESDLLALPGLVLAAHLNDAGGTVADDASPNSLDLTYSTSKASGAEIVNGLGTGMAASSALTASRAVPNGSPLQLSTGLTYAIWCNPTATSTNQDCVGRGNNFRLGIASGGAPHIYASISGFPTVDLRAPNWITAGSTYFLAGTYDGKVVRLYVNGELLNEFARPGSIANTTDALLVGSGWSAPFTGSLEGLAIFNRALDLGEIRSLFLAGTKVTPYVEGLKRDRLYDSESPVIAVAAAAGRRCAGCGGTRTKIEPKIKKALALDEHHPGCASWKAVRKPVVEISTSSNQVDYDQAILRQIEINLLSWTIHGTSMPKTKYYDGVRLEPRLQLPGAVDIFGPLAASAAVGLHHMGFDKHNPWMEFCIQQIERVWSLQLANGNIVNPSDAYAPGTSSLDFLGVPLAEAIIILRPHVDRATYNRWKANYVRMATYMQTQPLPIPEKDFYTNWNREWGESGIYAGAYLITGDEKWRLAYEAQYSFTISPPPNSGLPGRTYGLAIIPGHEPTLANGSDRWAFGYEHKDPAGLNTAGPVGFDPNYTQLSNSFLAHTFLMTKYWITGGDQRLVRIMNMQHNYLMQRVNATSSNIDLGGGLIQEPWALNGYGGSRQNNFSAYSTPSMALLKYQCGRTDITDAMIAGAWNATRNLYQGQMDGIGVHRQLHTDLIGRLKTLSTHPPLPV